MSGARWGARSVRVLVACALVAVTGRAVRADAPRVPRIVRAALASRGALSPRWPRTPAIDRASSLVGAPEARGRFAVTGQGATICVIDTGVDLRHRDLRDAAGHTRARWVLDLARAPRGNHAELESIGGGAVLDRDEIDAALDADDATLPVDSYGHGTAIASLALGDDAGVGEDALGPLAGIAPGAELVAAFALRPGVPGFDDDDLVRSAQFCVAAAADPRRLVIVLGMGGHDGAHDGSEPLERSLAALTASGAQVVVAAGNEGREAVHAWAALRDGETASVPLFVPAPVGAPGERFVALSVAIDAASVTSIALRAPDGTSTDFVAPGTTVTADHAGGRLVVDGSAPPRDAGARVVYAVVTGGGDVPAPLGGGTYTLLVRGPGRFDAWIAGADVGAALLSPTFSGPFADTRETVAVPGTAPELVTVGAVVSRARYDGAGPPVLAQAEEGDVAAFSATGPSRSGAPKPDLVAPGALLVAALSRDVREGDPQNLVSGSGALLAARRYGADRIVVSGTSFAAPIVAGALALALERAPSRGDRDRRLLLATARASTGAAWTAREGAGLLDVGAFLAARQGALADTFVAAQSPVSLTRAAAPSLANDVYLVARARDATRAPLRAGTLFVAIADGSVYSARIVDGSAELALPVPLAPAGSLVRYRVSIDDTPIGTATLRIQLDDARDRAGFAATGGCSTSPARGASLVWLGLALAALVATRRRRRAR